MCVCVYVCACFDSLLLVVGAAGEQYCCCWDFVVIVRFCFVVVLGGSVLFRLGDVR